MLDAPIIPIVPPELVTLPRNAFKEIIFVFWDLCHGLGTMKINSDQLLILITLWQSQLLASRVVKQVFALPQVWTAAGARTMSVMPGEIVNCTPWSPWSMWSNINDSQMAHALGTQTSEHLQKIPENHRNGQSHSRFRRSSSWRCRASAWHCQICQIMPDLPDVPRAGHDPLHARRLETTGDDWRRLETTGDDWRRLETTGDDWWRLVTTGDWWPPYALGPDALLQRVGLRRPWLWQVHPKDYKSRDKQTGVEMLCNFKTIWCCFFTVQRSNSRCSHAHLWLSLAPKESLPNLLRAPQIFASSLG